MGVKSMVLAVGAVFALLAGGCGRAAVGKKAQKQVFAAKGVVMEIQPGGKTVIIKHEAISNYMGAMTMPFDVANTNDLRGLQAGDSVRFDLVVTPRAGWIDHVVKLKKAPQAPPREATLEISHAVASLSEGDLLPNYRFTNELGQGVELNQFRGEPIAFTFFFTRCPFPNFCPRMTENFAEVAAKLNGDARQCPHWHLFSISFDTAKDTPARLLDYAKAHHYDPARWSFLTASRATMQEFADLFDERFWNEGDTIGHNLRTVVIDPSGHIQKIFEGSQWTADELVSEMIQASAKGNGGS